MIERDSVRYTWCSICSCIAFIAYFYKSHDFYGHAHTQGVYKMICILLFGNSIMSGQSCRYAYLWCWILKLMIELYNNERITHFFAILFQFCGFCFCFGFPHFPGYNPDTRTVRPFIERFSLPLLGIFFNLLKIETSLTCYCVLFHYFIVLVQLLLRISLCIRPKFCKKQNWIRKERVVLQILLFVNCWSLFAF